MSEANIRVVTRKEPKARMKGSEWAVIVGIAVVIIILIIIVFVVLIPRLFGGSTVAIPGGITASGCPPSDSPTNLMASQTTIASANIDLVWDPVLVTNTPDNDILGYRVYSSLTPEITEGNKRLAAFVVTPFINLTQVAQGDVERDTEYFFVVTTVDTCGESPISEEISFTTLE